MARARQRPHRRGEAGQGDVQPHHRGGRSHPGSVRGLSSGPRRKGRPSYRQCHLGQRGPGAHECGAVRPRRRCGSVGSPVCSGRPAPGGLARSQPSFRGACPALRWRLLLATGTTLSTWRGAWWRASRGASSEPPSRAALGAAGGRASLAGRDRPDHDVHAALADDPQPGVFEQGGRLFDGTDPPVATHEQAR